MVNATVFDHGEEMLTVLLCFPSAVLLEKHFVDQDPLSIPFPQYPRRWDD
jgi:hypothetical protein